MEIEVIWYPGQFPALRRRDLSAHVAVVFDVLRATSSELTALASGAEWVRPVETLEAALELKAKDPGLLLAGERGSFKPSGFDLGNSPGEYTPDRVRGRRIVHTTTNGTLAISSCAHAQAVYLGALLNLSALAAELLSLAPEYLIFVCAGTHSHFALEDGLAAGALIQELQPADPRLAGSAQGALCLWRSNASRLAETVAVSRNAERLKSIGLAADIEYCVRIDAVKIVARLDAGVARLVAA